MEDARWEQTVENPTQGEPVESATQGQPV